MKENLTHEETGFTQITNEVINDKNLSLTAKGLYCFMYSKPQNWVFSISRLSAQLEKDGKNKIASALQELKNNDWISYTKKKDGTGEYFIYVKKAKTRKPKSGKPKSGKPKSGKPKSGKPKSGKPKSGFSGCISNKDYSNKDYSNINTIYVSNETLDFQENQLSENISNIINYWNSLNNVTKHIKPETKVYETIKNYLSNLLNGKPLLSNKDNSISKPFQIFIDKYSIPEDLVYKKWTAEEIQSQLKITVSNLDKKIGLNSILFSGYGKSHFSFFYILAIGNNIDPKIKKLSKRLCHIIFPSPSKLDIIQGSKELEVLLQSPIITEKQLISVISWYKLHFKDKFTPKSYTIATFCEKYVRIKAAKDKKIGIKNGSNAFDDVDITLNYKEI